MRFAHCLMIYKSRLLDALHCGWGMYIVFIVGIIAVHKPLCVAITVPRKVVYKSNK